MNLKKYDIVWLNLSPTKGSEQQGAGPVLVVQNNLANQSRLQTVCIVPFTTNTQITPSGIVVKESKQNGLLSNSRAEVSQFRSVDKSRIEKKIGNLELIYHSDLRSKLEHFFDMNDDF